MLVLSRKQGESVQIGEGIVLTVLEVRRARVIVGIEAPRDVAVRRPANGSNAGFDREQPQRGSASSTLAPR